jgi:hypothetical protein
MLWLHGIVSAVLLLAGTGCPQDHMRDGFIDRAARKDVKEARKHECPPGTSWQTLCEESDEDELDCEGSCR